MGGGARGDRQSRDRPYVTGRLDNGVDYARAMGPAEVRAQAWMDYMAGYRATPRRAPVEPPPLRWWIRGRPRRERLAARIAYLERQVLA